MQEAVGKVWSGEEDWKSSMGEEVSSGEGEGMGVIEEVGREVEGGVQYEAGRFSLEAGTGRSSLARRKSCQGSRELASCYMAWLSLEWREWSG